MFNSLLCIWRSRNFYVNLWNVFNRVKHCSNRLKHFNNFLLLNFSTRSRPHSWESLILELLSAKSESWRPRRRRRLSRVGRSHRSSTRRESSSTSRKISAIVLLRSVKVKWKNNCLLWNVLLKWHNRPSQNLFCTSN